MLGEEAAQIFKWSTGSAAVLFGCRINVVAGCRWGCHLGELERFPGVCTCAIYTQNQVHTKACPYLKYRHDTMVVGWVPSTQPPTALSNAAFTGKILGQLTKEDLQEMGMNTTGTRCVSHVREWRNHLFLGLYVRIEFLDTLSAIQRVERNRARDEVLGEWTRYSEHKCHIEMFIPLAAHAGAANHICRQSVRQPLMATCVGTSRSAWVAFHRHALSAGGHSQQMSTHSRLISFNCENRCAA